MHTPARPLISSAMWKGSPIQFPGQCMLVENNEKSFNTQLYIYLFICSMNRSKESVTSCEHASLYVPPSSPPLLTPRLQGLVKIATTCSSSAQSALAPGDIILAGYRLIIIGRQVTMATGRGVSTAHAHHDFHGINAYENLIRPLPGGGGGFWLARLLQVLLHQLKIIMHSKKMIKFLVQSFLT